MTTLIFNTVPRGHRRARARRWAALNEQPTLVDTPISSNYHPMGDAVLAQLHSPTEGFFSRLFRRNRRTCNQVSCRGRWGKLGCNTRTDALLALWEHLSAEGAHTAMKRGVISDDDLVALQEHRYRWDVTDYLSVLASWSHPPILTNSYY